MPEQLDHPDPSAEGDEQTADSDRRWFERFTLQMTIQNASAGDISKAAADVRSYCADSGQSPQEAFGDPRHYATTLAAELASQRPAFDLRGVGLLLLTMLALTLLLVGSVSLMQLRGDEVPVTLGKVLLVTVAVPVWVFLTRAQWARRRPRDPVAPDRPAFDERYWRALWLTLGLSAVGTALWIGLDQMLFTVSILFFPGLGLALLATSQLLRWLVPGATADPRTTASP